MPGTEHWKRRLAAYELAYRELAGKLSALGFMHEGSVVRQRLTCGKSSCICHTDPDRRHGPYFYWTAKVKGRTVSRLLSKEEVDLYQEWIQNRRRFRDIQRKMLALAKKAAPVAVKIRKAESASADEN
jgi:hypothetical protein